MSFLVFTANGALSTVVAQDVLGGSAAEGTSARPALVAAHCVS
jgi:hypothetical protein